MTTVLAEILFFGLAVAAVLGLVALVYLTWRFERRRRLAVEQLRERPLDITPVPRPRRR